MQCPSRILNVNKVNSGCDNSHQIETINKNVTLEVGLKEVPGCELQCNWQVGVVAPGDYRSNQPMCTCHAGSFVRPLGWEMNHPDSGLMDTEEVSSGFDLSLASQESVREWKSDLYNGPLCNALAGETCVPSYQSSASNGIWPLPVELSGSLFPVMIDSFDANLSSLVWTQEILQSEQEKDTEILWIIRAMTKGQEKPAWRTILAESAGIKTLWAQWETLECHGGCCVKKHPTSMEGE